MAPSSAGAAESASLLRRAATRTREWQFRVWAFGEAIALRGLLAAARVLNEPEMCEFVRALLLSYAGRRVGASAAEHVAPGRELLEVYCQTGDEPLLDAARRLAGLHASFPRNGAGARLHRPDLSGWQHQIWVDCMDNEAPFLVFLGTVTGEERYIEQGVQEIAVYARLLQDDDTGLFFHGYEQACGRNGQLWARGNGWALLGLVDTLRLLPGSHPIRLELSQRLERLCEGLARWQEGGGLWHTIVTDADTYLESTLAAMVASAVPVASAAGLLDSHRHDAMAIRAMQAVLKFIDDDGSLRGVTEATPVAERAMYATRQFGVYPWGQGPLLLLLSHLCESTE